MTVLTGLAALGILSCTRHAPTVNAPSELIGLHRVDFETNHFQPCADSGRLGYRVKLRSAHWVQSKEPTSAPTRSGRIYYVRWIGSILPDTSPPPPPGTIRIGGGPTVQVREVLEARAPIAGECGWHPTGSE